LRRWDRIHSWRKIKNKFERFDTLDGAKRHEAGLLTPNEAFALSKGTKELGLMQMPNAILSTDNRPSVRQRKAYKRSICEKSLRVARHGVEHLQRQPPKQCGKPFVLLNDRRGRGLFTALSIVENTHRSAAKQSRYSLNKLMLWRV